MIFDADLKMGSESSEKKEKQMSLLISFFCLPFSFVNSFQTPLKNNRLFIIIPRLQPVIGFKP